MDVYEVGGAVRDALLGRDVRERDWVVVGATADELLARGYRQVGKDFPVFLHPQTGEEYALARTEKKIAPGHGGFSVHAAADVTLEEDLYRRDLTINAIARDADGLLLIERTGGLNQLKVPQLDLRGRNSIMSEQGIALAHHPLKVRPRAVEVRFHVEHSPIQEVSSLPRSTLQ